MVSVEVSENARKILKGARVGKTPTPKLFAAIVWWFAGLPEPLRLRVVRAAQEDGGSHATQK